jgi:hypothetical protein
MFGGTYIWAMGGWQANQLVGVFSKPCPERKGDMHQMAYRIMGQKPY